MIKENMFYGDPTIRDYRDMEIEKIIEEYLMTKGTWYKSPYKDEQKPADKVEHKRMTKLEDKLSSLVVNAVHIYCKENELDTPHYVGLILGDRLAKEWSQDILTLAKDELKITEQKPAWKPSDEQIMALRWVLNHIPYDSHKEEISGLLEQIKKLSEE